MQAETAQFHHILRQWSRKINRRGLGPFLAWLLEAAGPIQFLGAQLVYVSQPLAETIISTENMQALARVLEEPQETKMFIQMLQEREEERGG